MRCRNLEEQNLSSHEGLGHSMLQPFTTAILEDLPGAATRLIGVASGTCLMEDKPVRLWSIMSEDKISSSKTLVGYQTTDADLSFDGEVDQLAQRSSIFLRKLAMAERSAAITH